MRTRNRKAVCLMTALTRLIMTAACLLLCLTSCTREDADALPDGGDYPTTGKRIPLRFGSAGTATYAVSTADTRNDVTTDTDPNGFVLTPIWMPQTRAGQKTNTVDPYTSFIIYLFKKTDSGYQFDSYCRCIWGENSGGNYEVQNLYRNEPLPYAYENTTMRMVAISNGEIVTNGVSTTWMDEQITADKCLWRTGTPIDVDLNDGRNFMVYDSGDFKVREDQKINIKFEYLTSQVVILVYGMTAATIQEMSMSMKGIWSFGNEYITDASEKDEYGNPINKRTPNCFYNDDRFMHDFPTYPYIKYSVIPAVVGAYGILVPKSTIDANITIGDGMVMNMYLMPGRDILEKGKLFPYTIHLI